MPWCCFYEIGASVSWPIWGSWRQTAEGVQPLLFQENGCSRGGFTVVVADFYFYKYDILDNEKIAGCFILQQYVSESLLYICLRYIKMLKRDSICWWVLNLTFNFIMVRFIQSWQLIWTMIAKINCQLCINLLFVLRDRS